MDYLSIDLLIVIAFLFVSLGIGLWAGRGITDIRDYALANRSYGTTALVLTYLATYIGGGSLLGDSKEVFTSGIIITVMALGIGISYVLKAVFIAPHMHHFKGCLTLGDVMGSLYGPSSGIVAASLSILASIAVLGMQLSALGLVCTELLGIHASWGIIAGGLVLATYSAVGGIRAVTATDIFQFLVLFAIIPLVTAITLNKAGGFLSVVETVPANRFTIWGQENFSLYFTFFIAYSIFSVDMTNLTGMQRILMAKNGRQLRNMFLTTAAFDATFRLVVMFLALAGLALYPHIAPNTVVPHIVNELLPTGIRGLAIAGILAMIMSTADSHLHAAGLSLVHDVVQPFAKRYKLTINELKWTKYATLLIGCMAIGVGLHYSNLLKLSLQALSLMGPILSFPLIAGIIGLKPSQRAFYIAMILTVVTFLSAKFMLPAAQQHLTMLIGLLVNTFVFLGIHLIENQGFALANRPKETTLEARSIVQSRPSSLLQWSQQKVAQYGAPYMLFGIFCCINFTLPYFMWVSKMPANYDIVPYLRLLGAMMGGLLIVKEKWSPRLLPYFPLFWHFTLLYCIPFISTLMFLLTQGSVEWLINVAITIMFLIVLVDWFTFSVLTVLGVALGLLFYRLTIGPIALHLDLASGYLLVYQGVFATLIGLLFARRKEQRIAQKHSLLKGQGEAYQASFLQAAAEGQATLKALQYTQVEGLLTLTRELQTMHVAAEDEERMEAIQAKLIPMAFQLQEIDTRSQDYLRLQIEENWSIEQLLSTVRARVQEKGLSLHMYYERLTQRQTLTCDPAQLAMLLYKSLESLQASTEQLDTEEAMNITVALEDTQLSYPLPDVETGYVKQVPAVRIVITANEQIPLLASSYSPNLAAPSGIVSETVQALHQFANSRIIKSHYGYAEVTDHTLIYVVPVNVKEVRPQDMDKAYMELDAAPKRSNDHFVDKAKGIDAQAQEATFLADLATRSKANLGTVKMALEITKWYHGPKERHSGEPFYLHPLAVAQIVLDYNQDQATIIGALLHDTVEDTPMLLEHIEAMFGKETAGIVDLVTHLQSIPGSIYKVKLSASENLQMLERTGNKQGLYVKLADRMHNMRTIKGHSKVSKRRLIAEETSQFFVPLAEKLGLHKAAQELEQMCVEVFKMTE